jgi:Mlc titration factor MtfA (ptsG expression regulator)
MGLLRYLKRTALARRGFPAGWRALLEKSAPFYRGLSARERSTLEGRIRIFLAEKTFIGAKGLEVTDEMRLTIAAAAMRLIQRLDLSHYDRLTEIIVYEGDYHRPGETEEMLGESQEWGVVVLSWDSVRKGMKGRDEGVNTALHEFAHVLDRADGSYDGTPRLRSRKDYKRWREVMSRHFMNLQKGRRAELDVLDEYGAESEAEFFACATEAFFDRGPELKARLPDLYRILRRFYGFDP